jgi:hypothetical protein
MSKCVCKINLILILDISCAPRRRWPAADARGADGGGQWREVMEIPRAPDRSGAAQWSHGESGQWRGAMEP